MVSKNGHRFSPSLYMLPSAKWLRGNLHQEAECVSLTTGPLLGMWHQLDRKKHTIRDFEMAFTGRLLSLSALEKLKLHGKQSELAAGIMRDIIPSHPITLAISPLIATHMSEAVLTIQPPASPWGDLVTWQLTIEARGSPVKKKNWAIPDQISVS